MSETLRVLMVIGRYRPRIGGTEIQAERLARTLVRKGVVVEILTGREHGLTRYEQHDGIHIQRLWIPDVGIPLLNAIALGVGLYRAVLKRHRRFDILHAHNAYYPAYVSVAAATRLGKPSLIKIASSGERLDLEMLARQASLVGRHAANYLAQHTSAFVALNEQIAAALKAWGISEQRIVHIPNGIEVPALIQPKTRSAYRKRLNLPTGRPLLLCVGSLRAVKNQSLLIAAVQRLAEHGQDVTLILLGDGSLRPTLERQVEEHNLSDQVIFGGRVTNVLDYLYAADLFVLPSLVEGLPNALLEAMSVGLPCVASDIPGNRAVIQPDVNGLLFESRNVAQLANAIAELLADQARAASLGRRARETIESRYSIESVADRYLAMYRELLKR